MSISRKMGILGISAGLALSISLLPALTGVTHSDIAYAKGEGGGNGGEMAAVTAVEMVEGMAVAMVAAREETPPIPAMALPTGLRQRNRGSTRRIPLPRRA